jgi:hypothetical protein
VRSGHWIRDQPMPMMKICIILILVIELCFLFAIMAFVVRTMAFLFGAEVISFSIININRLGPKIDQLRLIIADSMICLIVIFAIISCSRISVF